MYLPVVFAFVFIQKLFNNGRRRKTGTQQIQTLRSIVRIHKGLGGHRADAAARMGAEHADGEEAACHRDPELSGRAARDDRPGQAARLRARPSAKASSPTYSNSRVGLMMCSSACSAKLRSMSFSSREPVITTIGRRPRLCWARSRAITSWPCS